MEKQVFETTFAGRSLIVEAGQLAQQANGAVLVRFGDTVVLSASVGTKEAIDGDFFPLTVNYEEKMYAAGKIPGGFIKREGRPSEHATLTARLIDRPIRPMFEEGYRNEVQITNVVLSVDPDNTPEMTAMLGSSLALCISDIPFGGPIAGVNVGRVDGKLIINPTVEEWEQSDIHLSVAGTKEAINMVESDACEVSEEEMLEALLFGHEAIKNLCDFQLEIQKAIGKEKMEVKLASVDPELEAEIMDRYKEEMLAAIQTKDKQERGEKVDALRQRVNEVYEANTVEMTSKESEAYMKEVNQIVDAIEKVEVRRLITEEKVRPDGRKIDEIRPLAAEVDLLPRAHGSGLFTRGQTQALSVTTLAPLSEAQVIDGLGAEESKRFIHHYNFPQFSVGSTGRAGSPGRREIGHGALGERALKHVIPSEKDFPYAIRTVAEVLESNGSSSQASICAGTLSLMAAGVPIKAPVAGIAMGLIMDETTGNYTVLTDIQGLEDHLGDMDFKVAGTAEGITALQMDIKIKGITKEILEEALAQAKLARFQILDVLHKAIKEPRKHLSQYAPKIKTFMIKPEKIKEVIGKGGDTINSIIEATGVKIDIEQDGQVSVFSEDEAMIDRACAMIDDIVREAEVGQVYDAKVVRIEKYGAFVNLFGDKDALLHISQISKERINNVEDVLKLGDTIKVKVTEIDDKGRINVSHKVLENE